MSTDLTADIERAKALRVEITSRWHRNEWFVSGIMNGELREIGERLVAAGHEPVELSVWDFV